MTCGAEGMGQALNRPLGTAPKIGCLDPNVETLDYCQMSLPGQDLADVPAPPISQKAAKP
jgi:hypothetical protein